MKAMLGCMVVWLMMSSVDAGADVMPFGSSRYEAIIRMEEDPGVFDVVDEFCVGKKPKDACVIRGPVQAGGGNGVCIRSADQRNPDITMSCERSEKPDYERVSLEEGYAIYCEVSREPQSNDWICDYVPLGTQENSPCAGKVAGQACKVESKGGDGNAFKGTGTCQQAKNEDERWLGLRCESARVERRYIRIERSWWQRLFGN